MPNGQMEQMMLCHAGALSSAERIHFQFVRVPGCQRPGAFWLADRL
jgi:hypothetical protein